jgi:hypothetical protein
MPHLRSLSRTLIREHPGEVLDVLARMRSLRLPSVALLEFIPMKIGAGMTIIVKGFMTHYAIIYGSSGFLASDIPFCTPPFCNPLLFPP